MRHPWLLAWLNSELRLRLLSVFSLTSLLLVLIWLQGIRPVELTRQQLQQQTLEQMESYHQQRQSLLALPPLSLLERRLAGSQQRAIANSKPFSVPVLLAASGAELERWQPEIHGGELLLNLSWQQFTGLLTYLCTRDPPLTISRLTLEGQAPRLQLLMALIDEN